MNYLDSKIPWNKSFFKPTMTYAASQKSLEIEAKVFLKISFQLL